jgi:hypothetical protein
MFSKTLNVLNKKDRLKKIQIAKTKLLKSIKDDRITKKLQNTEKTENYLLIMRINANHFPRQAYLVAPIGRRHLGLTKGVKGDQNK